jgi:hypothetical protein
MKKITILISVLTLIAFSWQTNAQTLNKAAGWPNTNWTLSGNYTTTALLYDPTIRTNFRFNAAAEDLDFFTNDFETRISATCTSPSAVTSTNITTTSVDLAWTENGTATSWEVEWDVAGFTQGTGNYVTLTTNPYNFTGLSASTRYDFYVRAICASDDISSWSSKHSFNPLIQTPVGISCMGNTTTNALIEEFNSLGTWTGNISASSTNGDWVLPFSGSTPSTATGPAVAYSGTNYAYYEPSGATTNIASLVSPAIDLTNALTEAELSFWMFAYGADITTLRVGVSTSATGPFTEIFSTSGQLQNSNADAWQEVGVNLNTYLGQTIYIEFNYAGIGGFNADLAIDLVKVETCMTTLNTRINTVNIALTVSPNPSKGVFTLTGTTSDLKELNIKVINPLGQTVYSKSNFNNIANINEKIDLSNKTKGIYFINVTSDKGVKTYKVIVK